jgi:putative ABC transport system permease protein
MSDFSLAFQFARRDLRGGIKGLRLLIACLVLGVAAIAGVGSLSSAILASLSAQGQSLLGGDVEIRTTHRQLMPDERAAASNYGKISEVARLRAMVQNPKTNDALLAELKAVDGAYPMYGTFVLAGGGDLQQQLKNNGAVVDEILADRIGLKIGDELQVGRGAFVIRGFITTEPDRASEGFALGPSVIIAMDTLARTDLVQPGSLVRYHYRLKLPEAADVKAVRTEIDKKFPKAGWRLSDRTNGAPGMRRFVDQLGQFLTLVGLTALMVSGLGVANAVNAHLEKKTGAIATLKSLGASSKLIFRIWLMEIALVSAVAIFIGLLLGSLVPFLSAQYLADKIPVPPQSGIYPVPLALAAAFGILVALAATIWPLARARETPPARLFRAKIAGLDPRPKRKFLISIGLCVAAAIALAVLTADQKWLALGVVIGGAALLLLLRGVAWMISAVARRLPVIKQPLLRLSIANLHRPGSSAPAVITALGLGLSLLATLAVVEANLSAAVNRNIPDRAPSFFFVDIPGDQLDSFKQKISAVPGAGKLVTVPSLRGPVTRINNIPVEDFKPVKPEDAWVLRGDRGLTYAADFPEQNELVAGAWWPKNYAGPPLISFDAEMAAALGIGLGDTITVSVLGTDVTAKIASLRKINWDSLGFNFVIIFAPGTLEAAPHGFMATIEATPQAETALFRQVARDFPTVSAIRMKEVLTQVGSLLTQVSTAVRATALITVLAGILVLIGAIAMVQQARTYDAVILKLLGATRGQVLRAYLSEYLLLGLTAGMIAVAAGLAAGWYTVTEVLDLPWTMPWWPLALTAFGGALVTILLSLAGAYAVLSARPNQSLRQIS